MQRIPLRAADRGGADRRGQLAHGQHRDVALQLVETRAVLVDGGPGHAEPLRDRRQRQPLEADLVGDLGGGDGDPVASEPGARHQGSTRSEGFPDGTHYRASPEPVIQTSSSGSEINAAAASDGTRRP